MAGVVPVRSVQLMSESLDGSRAVMYTDHEPVLFSESELRRFRCVINGSYPTPEVAVYIGDDDVTGQFVANVELMRDGVPPYYRDLYYRVQLINESFLIRHFLTLTINNNANAVLEKNEIYNLQLSTKIMSIIHA